MFRIFLTSSIGEIGKKDYENAKRIKKTNSKWWNLWRNLDFKYLYFFEKYAVIFQNSLIKSLIHKLKKHKKIQQFFDKYTHEIENKMSKIKKNKKTNSKPQNFEKKKIYLSTFFLKELLEFSREIVGRISNPSNKTPQNIP